MKWCYSSLTWQPWPGDEFRMEHGQHFWSSRCIRVYITDKKDCVVLGWFWACIDVTAAKRAVKCAVNIIRLSHCVIEPCDTDILVLYYPSTYLYRTGDYIKVEFPMSTRLWNGFRLHLIISKFPIFFLMLFYRAVQLKFMGHVIGDVCIK